MRRWTTGWTRPDTKRLRGLGPAGSVSIALQVGRTPVVGIASGSQGHGGKKPPAAYNLFHIGGEKGRWTLSKERFGLTEDKATFAREHEELLPGG